MKNSCYNLPNRASNSVSCTFRKSSIYNSKLRFMATLENRASSQLGSERTRKTESFLKKTHNNIQIQYQKSHEGLLFTEAKQLCSKSNSHYLNLAKQLNFTEWQTKLLMRDLENLNALVSNLSSCGYKDEKFILKSLFRVIQEFLQNQQCFQGQGGYGDIEKKTRTKKEKEGFLLDFLIQLRFNLRITPTMKKIIYDPSHQDKDYPSNLKKLELVIKNIQIKTRIEGYQSAQFSSHPLEKLSPLWFNMIYLLRSKEGVALINSYRRIVKEMEDLKKNPPSANYFIIPSTHDFRVWTGVVVGPPDSIYHGGIFYISITIPTDYPFKPPKMKFLNQIYHPQVFEDGAICLDVLQEQFSPALVIDKLLFYLCACLKEPKHESFVHCPAHNVFVKNGDPKEFALQYVEKFA